MQDEYGNDVNVYTGAAFALWDNLCECWITEPCANLARVQAELDAYRGGGQPIVCGYGGEYRPISIAAALRQGEADKARAAQAQAFATRQAAVVASLLATPATAPVAKPDRLTVLAKMLAANEAALAAELAKRKQDKGEVARLRDNCERLRADLGILTPEGKLLKAIFG